MGLPGSGKSYVAQHLVESFGFTRLSGEGVTHALFGSDKCSGEEYALAYETLRQCALDLLQQGYSIVIDGTNLKKVFRQQIYDDVPHQPSVLLYLTIDQATALRRIENRVKSTADPTNVSSGCSPKTFAAFQDQLEEPSVGEPRHFIIPSDDHIFSRVDQIIKEL